MEKPAHMETAFNLDNCGFVHQFVNNTGENVFFFDFFFVCGVASKNVCVELKKNKLTNVNICVENVQNGVTSLPILFFIFFSCNVFPFPLTYITLDCLLLVIHSFYHPTLLTFSM